MRDFDTTSADQEERLPVHPWTILVGVLRQRRFLFAFALVSAVVGLVVAVLFGGPVYHAQSVLLYNPETDGRVNDPALTVPTQANMVLLDTNLEETRRRLSIPVSQKQVALACVVNTQPNSALIMIDVDWQSPQVAARIANTLRDVFVENQEIVRRAKADLEVRDLRSRIDQLRARLKAIDDKLGELADTSGMVDVDKETQNYLSELTSVELLYDQARADQQSIEMQIQMREHDHSPGSVDAEPVGDLNVRAARLQNTIHEDQTIRAGRADLEGLKIQRDRALDGFQQGVTAKAEYDKSEAAYQAEKERAVDTHQVAGWRSAISQLDQGILAANAPTVTQRKLFQLGLDRLAADSKVLQYGQTVDRLRKTIAGLPKLQRDFVTFSRETEPNETELKSLLEKLGRAERAQMAKSSEFETIADATPPAFPIKNRHLLFFFGITIFGSMLGLCAVVSRELLNGTVRSAGEAAVKIPIPLLGVLPKGPATEPFRALALHVRRTVPKPGARILFLSARPQDGVTTVIDRLAESLRHDHVNVLVTNAQESSDDSHDIVLLDGRPILESIDSEVAAPSCDAAILVVAAGVTPVSDITEAIARIRSTHVPIAGAVLNGVDKAYL
jgi:uncharacterized protein involved in exopolysaccharide biosynthesis